MAVLRAIFRKDLLRAGIRRWFIALGVLAATGLMATRAQPVALPSFAALVER
jgi:hypothetical protein